MRDFIIGFFLCAMLFIFSGLSPQIGNNYDTPQEIQTDMRTLFTFRNNPSFRVSLTTPTISEFVNDGELVVVNRTGVVSLFTKVGTSTYSITLNK